MDAARRPVAATCDFAARLAPMAIDDPTDGLWRVLWRVFMWFFDQLVVDILLRVPGYFLVKLFTPAGAPDPDPDSFLVALVGLLFWLAVCAVGWFVLSQIRFSPRSWS